MITAHDYTLTPPASPAPVPILSGVVQLDESWSPYAQAAVTIPLPDEATRAVLDPRSSSNPRVYLRCEVRTGRTFALSQITAAAGSSTAAWTSSLDGGPLSTWSAAHGSPYNTSGLTPTRSRTFNLGVRRLSMRRSSGEATLDLASDEALLQDHARVADAAYTPGNTMRAIVAYVLAQIGAELQYGTLDPAVVELEAAAWHPGVTAWDYLRPLLEATSTRLYCDEARRWWLVAPLTATAGTLALTPDTLTELDDVMSREGDVDALGWADAVVVTYTWTDSAGIEHVRYDAAQDRRTVTRVLRIEHERRYPGPGAARALLYRARARGRAHVARAVSDYSATPGMRLTVAAWPGESTSTDALVSAVAWDLSADEMTVQSRDLIAADAESL